MTHLSELELLRLRECYGRLEAAQLRARLARAELDSMLRETLRAHGAEHDAGIDLEHGTIRPKQLASVPG